MNIEASRSRRAYIRAVELAVDERDEDKATQILREAQQRVMGLGEDALRTELGSPEDFARSVVGNKVGSSRHVMRSESVLSLALLPFGVLVLFSFGGQLRFGLAILLAEWFLARLSGPIVRHAWSVLAATLAGEIVYLGLPLLLDDMERLLLLVLSLASAGIVVLLFLRTTRAQDRGRS